MHYLADFIFILFSKDILYFFIDPINKPKKLFYTNSAIQIDQNKKSLDDCKVAKSNTNKRMNQIHCPIPISVRELNPFL